MVEKTGSLKNKAHKMSLENYPLFQKRVEALYATPLLIQKKMERFYNEISTCVAVK